MVAAPFKRNQKIKKEMKRKKENEKKKSVIRVICRRCCVGGKSGGIHNRSLAKKGLTGKETHPKKSCRGSKGPFHSYDKEKKN